jgi:hypothetical protein
MAAAQSSANNLQKGLASLGEGVAAGLKQYGKNKDERDLLEGDVDAIKNIVESDPARYADIARDETNIKKFGEVPDMSLSKLRAYSTSLRTQMAAVDRRDAQSIQDLQRQKLQSEADDRKGFQAAMGIVPKVEPQMQTQFGEKTVLPVKPNEAGALGWFAADRPEEYSADVLKPGVPVVSEGQDTASRKDIRDFYGGMAARVMPGISEAIGRFGAGAKEAFIDPAARAGKALGALAQVPSVQLPHGYRTPGAPALEGYFQPEHEDIRATGPGGAPTPEDIARLDYNRSERERMKGRYPQHIIDEMLPPLKVEETPLYVPREKGDAPGSRKPSPSVDHDTGLPNLTHYAGETSDLRIPGDTSKAPIGYWTGLAQDGRMPDDAYTITADGKKTMMQMMSREDIAGWPTADRLLELNPHLQTWHDSTGGVQPGNKEGDWVPPAGMKILIPNETLEKDASGQPINVSRYRDPNAPLTDEEKAAKVRDQITALVPTSGTPWERIRGLGANLAEQGRQDQASLEAEMAAPVHTFPFEQRQTSKEVQVGERDVTWKDAHARMIQHLVDNKQQITPALSKSLEDFAKTQYAAEEAGLTFEPVPNTDDVLIYNNGKYVGKSTKSASKEIEVRPVGDSGISVVTQGGRIYQVIKPSSESGLNEFQGKAFLNLSRMQSSQTEIERITKEFDPTSSWQRLKILLPKEMEPAKWEEYQAAMYEWTDAMLRQTTGAQATEAEIERNILTYFPQPGQGKGKQEQSARMRANVMNTISRMVPPEYVNQGGPLQPGAGVGTNRNYTAEEINDPRAKKKK